MDYAELVTEVQSRTDDPNVPARAVYLVRAAEREIERTLRVAEMVRTAVLTTDENGAAILPLDFIQARVSGAEAFAGGPFAGVRMDYYARLPSLPDVGTNWLLEADPEVYVAAVMAQVYSVAGDIDKANVARAYLDKLITDMRRADSSKRYSTRRVTLAGLMPYHGRHRT